MAGNIVDYIKTYGKYSMSEKIFNDVDSLVLSQFSYLKLEGMVPDMDSAGRIVTIEELAVHPNRDNMFADERYRDVNTALFEAMRDSRRFGKTGICFYENIIDEEKETQFSAMTFRMEEGPVYIAYRGTDETIVGWKEDFNMAFAEAVTGQRIAEKYLNHAAGKFAGNFMIGGHSKGGNFAVYAAMKCREDVRARIDKIYSHDGPGFRPELLQSEEYERIKDRVCKILPRASLVGMLLQHQENYYVVESRGMGVMQHNPFKWQIRNGSFVKAKEIYYRRRILDDALNEWILSMDDEQLHIFVDTLFQVIAAAKVDNLIDFGAEWKKSATGMLNAVKELEPETKKMFRKIIRKLFETASDKARAELKPAGEKHKRGGRENNKSELGNV